MELIIYALVGSATILYLFLRRITRKTPLDLLPGPPSSSWLSGNMAEFSNKHGWDFHLRVTQDYGPIVKLRGMLNKPMLYVFDPLALHHAFIKDPSSFEQSEESYLLFRIITGQGMGGVPRDIHHRQRRIVNPAFSSAHIRRIAPIIYETARKVCEPIKARVLHGPQEIDLHKWLIRVSMEMIGQSGLGYSFDPLTEDASIDELGDNIKTALSLIVELPVLRLLLPFLTRCTSLDFPRHMLQFFPNSRVRKYVKTSNAILQRSKEIYEEKKLAVQQGDEALVRQIGRGKDILSLLIKANLAASDKDRLSEPEVIGQIAGIVMGGTDSIANATSRVLHCLALRPDIQAKLRSEILEANCDDTEDYDKLMHLPWLDAVIKETLRVHASAPIVSRSAAKDTVLPLSRPVRCTDGTMMKEVPVPKGTMMFIGVYGCNWSKDIWGDDALEWKPERWLSELPSKVSSVPGVFANLMTFIAGPYSCIGYKLAEVEMKILLSVLVSQFAFELAEGVVDWKIGHVVWPTASYDSDEGQFHLKVSLA